MNPATIAMLIQAGVGAIGGGLENASKIDQLKALRDNLGTLSPQIQQAYQAQIATLEPYQKELLNQGANRDTYYNYLGQFNPSDYNVKAPETFNYDINAETQKLLAPDVAYRISQGAQAIDEGGNKSGNLYSGAAGRALQTMGQNEAQQAYGTALNAAQTQQNTAYNTWTQDFLNQQTEAKTKLANWQAKAQALGIPVKDQQAILDQITQTTQNALATSATRQLNVSSQQAGANAGIQGADSFAGYAGSILGGATGGMNPQGSVQLGQLFSNTPNATVSTPTSDMNYSGVPYQANQATASQIANGLNPTLLSTANANIPSTSAGLNTQYTYPSSSMGSLQNSTGGINMGQIFGY